MIESIVTWKWTKPGYRSTFTSEIVNAKRREFARHYARPHRFICITDDPAGLDPGIEAVPLWDLWSDVANPTWGEKGPSCYRRLASFHPDFERIAGRRFVSVDLDVVAVGDLAELWDRSEDFVICKAPAGNQLYNGSMYLMTAGSRRQVFDRFNPVESPKLTAEAGLRGSDQAWIQYVLGTGEATWSQPEGVYSYRECVRRYKGLLPRGARMVMFWGKPDPWEAVEQSPWIAKPQPDESDFVNEPVVKGLLADLALRYAGKTAVVMGGGVSLPDHLDQCPEDAVYISANQHGVMLRRCDYIVALDDIEAKLRPFKTPIIGRRVFADYRIQDWRDCHALENSGRAAAWVAAVLGCRQIILAGMDCYTAGTYHHDPTAPSTGHAKSLDEHLSGWRALSERLQGVMVRSCGGPTAGVFGQYDPREEIPAWSPYREAVAMQGIVRRMVRTRPMARINGRRVEGGLDLIVSHSEFAALTRLRKAIPL